MNLSKQCINSQSESSNLFEQLLKEIPEEDMNSEKKEMNDHQKLKERVDLIHKVLITVYKRQKELIKRQNDVDEQSKHQTQ